jgi:hypothetical protein
VKNVITYTLNIGREVDVGPKQSRTMYLHYLLDTNADGQITGGRYLGDSARIDMLWTPLKPVQGGEEGNKRGNPHVDVKQVLAIWRESVSEDIRGKWLNVDPTEEDRILPASEEAPPAEATASAPAAAESPAATAAAAATEATIAEPAAATPAETATPGSTTTSIETPASSETPAPPAAPAAPESPAP